MTLPITHTKSSSIISYFSSLSDKFIASSKLFNIIIHLVICVNRESRSKARNECDRNCAPNQGKASSGGVSLSLCICGQIEYACLARFSYMQA